MCCMVLISLQVVDSYQALREEIDYLRKLLAQSDLSNQQLSGTEEHTMSGSKDEEESDGECVLHFMLLYPPISMCVFKCR